MSRPSRGQAGSRPVRMLFLNMPGALRKYDFTRSRMKAVMQPVHYLGTLVLAATAREHGGDCRVLDLQCHPDPYRLLDDTMAAWSPDIVGLSFATLLFDLASELAAHLRRRWPGTRIIAGGPHPTVCPEETLRDVKVDAVVIGEGESAVAGMAGGIPFDALPDMAFLGPDGTVVRTRRSSPVADLDQLPMPALDLVDARLYDNPKAVSRQSPLGGIETARGCPFACVYCSKAVFGRRMRGKSPSRIVAEFRHYQQHGYREIAVLDDLFTYDIDRAKTTCEALIRNRNKTPWQLDNGIRVDGIDREFLDLARRAGCYKVSFGLESGDDTALAAVGKRATSADGRRAVLLAKAAGMEVVGFFMLGLPTDTEDSIRRTIAFARSLPLDYAKATFMTPLPGTAVFDDLERRGLILSRDWSRYHFHRLAEAYRHPNLSWEALQRAYDRFYAAFYLRPEYIIPRLFRSIRRGEVGADLRMAWHLFRPDPQRPSPCQERTSPAAASADKVTQTFST